MRRKPRWFEGNSTASGLTEAGRAAVLDLADLPIDGIVLDRLVDTPPQIRRALISASCIGQRFVVELVDTLAWAQFACAARDDLVDAETRFRFLRDIVDRSRNDIGGFAERLFYDAAQEYRLSGQAGADLDDMPGEEALQGALEALLVRLVSDPDLLLALAPEDRATALWSSAEHLAGRHIGETGQALAMLCDLERRRGNTEGSNEAARRFLAGYSDGTWTALSVAPHLANTLADAGLHYGNTSAAAALSADLVGDLARRTEHDPGDSYLMINHAAALSRLARVVAPRNAGRARDHLGQSEASWRLLVARHPEDPYYRKNLIEVTGNLAAATGQLGDATGSRSHYEAAVAQARALVETHPDDAEARELLGTLHLRQGRNAQTEGNYNGALEATLAALAILADSVPGSGVGVDVHLLLHS